MQFSDFYITLDRLLFYCTPCDKRYHRYCISFQFIQRLKNAVRKSNLFLRALHSESTSKTEAPATPMLPFFSTLYAHTAPEPWSECSLNPKTCPAACSHPAAAPPDGKWRSSARRRTRSQTSCRSRTARCWSTSRNTVCTSCRSAGSSRRSKNRAGASKPGTGSPVSVWR